MRERDGSSPSTQHGVHDGRSGGEGGIRTHGAFAHRFSRAAPSTTRTPLRRQRIPSGHGLGPRRKSGSGARGRCPEGRARAVADLGRFALHDPGHDLEAARQCLAAWSVERPNLPRRVAASGIAKTRPSTFDSSKAPTHMAHGSMAVKTTMPRQIAAAEASRGLAHHHHHGMGSWVAVDHDLASAARDHRFVEHRDGAVGRFTRPRPPRGPRLTLRSCTARNSRADRTSGATLAETDR